jgi:hypothetical protein
MVGVEGRRIGGASPACTQRSGGKWGQRTRGSKPLALEREVRRHTSPGNQEALGRRGVIEIRGDPERNKICRQAILSAVMGGRPIDPIEAARRMYASRQFETRMAGCARGGERGKWRENTRGRSWRGRSGEGSGMVYPANQRLLRGQDRLSRADWHSADGRWHRNQSAFPID